MTPEVPDTTPDETPEEPDTMPDVTPEVPDTMPDVIPEEPDTTPENNKEDSSMTGAAVEKQENTDTKEAVAEEKTPVVKKTTAQTVAAGTGTAVQIKKPAPKTGDVNAAAVWIVLLALSGTLTASVVYRKSC